MRLPDTDNIGDASKERTIFDVTLESPILLIDSSSDSVMLDP